MAEQIGGRCVHFTGISNPCCEAGINYDDVRQDSKNFLERFPCFRGGPDVCELREFPTPEAVAAEEAHWGEAVANMIRARVAIVEHSGGKRGVVGSIACPCCEGGTLKYSVAGINGHVHAACTTPGCAQWME